MCVHDPVSFKIFLQCSNCLRKSARIISPPRGDDAPCDVDELMESAFLQNLGFVCSSCESTIARIVAIDIVAMEAA